MNSSKIIYSICAVGSVFSLSAYALAAPTGYNSSHGVAYSIPVEPTNRLNIPLTNTPQWHIGSGFAGGYSMPNQMAPASNLTWSTNPIAGPGPANFNVISGSRGGAVAIGQGVNQNMIFRNPLTGEITYGGQAGMDRNYIGPSGNRYMITDPYTGVVHYMGPTLNTAEGPNGNFAYRGQGDIGMQGFIGSPPVQWQTNPYGPGPLNFNMLTGPNGGGVAIGQGTNQNMFFKNPITGEITYRGQADMNRNYIGPNDLRYIVTNPDYTKSFYRGPNLNMAIGPNGNYIYQGQGPVGITGYGALPTWQNAPQPGTGFNPNVQFIHP